MKYTASSLLIILTFAAVLIEISFSGYVKTSKFSSLGSSSTPILHKSGSGEIWRTKTEWKFHWVYVPVWKKVWTPVEIKEYLPPTNLLHSHK